MKNQRKRTMTIRHKRRKHGKKNKSAKYGSRAKEEFETGHKTWEARWIRRNGVFEEVSQDEMFNRDA